MEDVKQPNPQAEMLTPHGLLGQQIRNLNGALKSLPYYGPEETKLVRTYIIAQIEALKWAQKLYEV